MVNYHVRAQMVRSMDTIARSVNDEELVVGFWFTYGVADGDINDNTTDEEIVELGYCEDDTFGELMAKFLSLIRMAKDESLYCDGITSW